MMVQNAIAGIGHGGTDPDGERSDVVPHCRADSIGKDCDSPKMSEYLVTDWPRIVRITDSRAGMRIFVAVSIFPIS